MTHVSDFEKILRDTHAQLRAYIAGMGVPLDTVDDLAQDVYLEFYRHGGNRPADVEPVRWLKGITKNLCMSHFRTKKWRAGSIRRYQEHITQILAGTTTEWEEVQADASVQAALKRCMEKIPDRQRTFLTLRYEKEQTSEEIGRQCNATAEAVRVALLRVRTALKDCVEKNLERGAAR